MKSEDFGIRLIHGRRQNKLQPELGLIEVEYYMPPIRKRWSSGVYVAARNWKNGVVRGLPDAPALNSKIRKKIEYVEQLAAEGFPSQKVAAQVIEAKTSTFPEWLVERINARTDITESTRRQHLVTAREVEKCGLLKFSDLTLRGIQILEDHVRRHVAKQTSVYNYHKRLKPYLFIAERLGLIARNPYRDYKTPHGVADERAYLTEAERDAVAALPLTGTRAKVRDMFILACYTGLAFVDLVKISRDNIAEVGGHLYLIDRRHKTGSKYKLRLLPPAVEILERYGYQMNLACNQICNRELKMITLMAGINKTVTMHVGRHTFATWALNRGVPIEVVSKMLAHSDIQTTQIYAKIMQSSIDRGFEMLL